MDLGITNLGIRIWTPPEHFAATADFYRDVLGLTCTWRGEDIAIYEFSFGPTLAVERIERTPEHAPILARFTGAVLTIPDIEATHRELTGKGVPFDGPPTRQSWGGIMAFFRDPAGNELTLLQRPA
jgi:catechol 2,3-dioxygenase-like lactoylglutathione lyase family enzyme